LDREFMKTKIVQALEIKPSIRFAYLFGSQAKGGGGVLSDIDIAVFFDEAIVYTGENTYGPEYELVLELEKALGAERVDLVVLNKAPIFLRFQVLKGGELIFCRSEKDRLRFHEETIRLYLDFLPFRNVQNAYLRKRIAGGTYGR